MIIPPTDSFEPMRKREKCMLTAAAIMTEDVVTIHPECPVQEAVEILVSEQISGLPVTDDQGKLVGIVTEFALLAIAYDPQVLSDSVSQHMTTEIVSVDVHQSVSHVADLCLLHRVRRVPVLKDGRLVGLISRRDVLQALYQSHVPAFTA